MTMLVVQECFQSYSSNSHESKHTTTTTTTTTPPPAQTGWSCLQALSIKGCDKDDSVYVHPLSKLLKPWTLNEKSLEMCTETLGSETGSDDGVLSLDGYDDDEEPESPTARERRRLNLYRKSSPREFPPPLATVSGSDGIRIKAKRDGGRLVMEAYSVPPRHCHLLVDRSHGRLKLSLVRDNDRGSFEDEDNNDNYVSQYNNEVSDLSDENSSPDELKTEMIDYNETIVEKEVEKETIIEMIPQDTEEDPEDEPEVTVEIIEQYESDMGIRKGTDVINWGLGGRMGISGFQRPTSRCKERREKIFMNWESFWVATS